MNVHFFLVLLFASWFASTSLATQLPFNKKYDEALLQKVVNLPMPELLKEITKTTDIVIIPTRTPLDKELPRTALEDSPVVKVAKASLPKKVRETLGDIRGNNALMIEKGDPDVKVSRNTIYTNEFIDGYTLIHEYMHSIMNMNNKVPTSASNLDTYRAFNKAAFLYSKIFANRALLNDSHWRNDMISALEDHCEALIRETAATNVEEVLIETVLRREIKTTSPHYNEYRVANGKSYSDYSLATIFNNFNTSIDKVDFITNEIKHLESISEETRKADLARIAAMKEKYLKFRDEVVKLQEFAK